MTLIRCPECGSEVSDKALACIRCGYPLNSSSDTLYSDSMETNPDVAAVSTQSSSMERDVFENRDSWSVELVNIKEKIIKAIKTTRELFGMDLFQAKRLMEQPRVIVAHNITRDQATRLVEEYKIGGIEARVIKNG